MDGLRSQAGQPQPGQYEFDAIAIRHWFGSPKVAKTLCFLQFATISDRAILGFAADMSNPLSFLSEMVADGDSLGQGNMH